MKEELRPNELYMLRDGQLDQVDIVTEKPTKDPEVGKLWDIRTCVNLSETFSSYARGAKIRCLSCGFRTNENGEIIFGSYYPRVLEILKPGAAPL